MRRAVCSLGIGLSILLVGLAGVLLAPSTAASAASLPQATQPHDRPAEPKLPPGATPQPGVGSAVVNQITNITQHIIQFQYDTMTDAVTRMSASMSRQAYGSASRAFSDALDVMIFGDFGIAPRTSDNLRLFTDLIYPHWQVTFTLALLLLPATLVLTATSALRQGVASVLTYADLKEAVIGWFIAVGAAAASYYLLSLAFRLSVAGAQAVAQAPVGSGPLTGAAIANVLFNSHVLDLLWVTSNGDYLLISLIGFFVLFLACSIVLGLALALAAFTVLAYLLTVLAPLVLVLGTLPPLNWLKALWLKGVVVVALLPVADVLLLKAAEAIAFRLLTGEGANQAGVVLSSICIGAGVLSVLIAINFKVAEMVFGALGEVIRQAGESVVGIAGLAAGAVAFAVGGAALGVPGTTAALGGLLGRPAEGGAGPAASASPTLPTDSSARKPASPSGAGTASVASQATVTPADVTRHLSAGGAGGGASPSGGAGAVPGSGENGAAQLAESASGNPAGGGTGAQSAGAGGGASNGVAQSGSAEAPGQAYAAADAKSSNGNGTGRQATPGTQLPAYPTGAAAQSRQAHLASSFGAMLSRSRNPLMQGMGMGFQAAGALAGTQAGLALDQERAEQQAAGAQQEEIRQQERAASQAQAQQRNALYWAERFRQKPDMGTPAEVLTPKYPIANVLSGVILGGLQQNGFTAPLEEAIVPLVEQSYGHWRDHFEAGDGYEGVGGNDGVLIRREFFNAMAEPMNALNPSRLEDELQGIASRYGFELGPDLHAAADKMQSGFQSLT